MHLALCCSSSSSWLVDCISARRLGDPFFYPMMHHEANPKYFLSLATLKHWNKFHHAPLTMLITLQCSDNCICIVLSGDCLQPAETTTTAPISRVTLWACACSVFAPRVQQLQSMGHQPSGGCSCPSAQLAPRSNRHFLLWTTQARSELQLYQVLITVFTANDDVFTSWMNKVLNNCSSLRGILVLNCLRGN